MVIRGSEYQNGCAMKNKDREIIFNKYDGRCAYCGDPLQKGWHVDELLPCRRKYKYTNAYYRDSEKNKYTWQEVKKLSEEEMNNRGMKWIDRKLITDGYEHPERLNIDNQMPSCASCNINKHSMSLEDFRGLIAGFMKHLNEHNTQYKIAKRYGLVQETIKPIVFYFESVG